MTFLSVLSFSVFFLGLANLQVMAFLREKRGSKTYTRPVMWLVGKDYHDDSAEETNRTTNTQNLSTAFLFSIFPAFVFFYLSGCNASPWHIVAMVVPVTPQIIF